MLPEGVRIARLDAGSDGFTSFAFAPRRSQLLALEPPWVAIGAWWRGVAAGLALGTIGPDGAWLDSVSVAAPLRRRGIGGALLAALQEEAQRAGARRIATQYSSFLGMRPAFEALLARHRWSPPELIDVILVGLAARMAEGGGAWGPVQRAMREMSDYAVGPFTSGNAQDDETIGALLAAAPELGIPDPRANGSIDRDVSVMLRHRGTLIGWVAGERLQHSIGRGTLVSEATSIHYSGARLAEGHHKAIMLVGYHAAFSRQAALFGPASRAVYRTHPGALAMFDFTRARFAPMALHVEERIGASLALELEKSAGWN